MEDKKIIHIAGINQRNFQPFSFLYISYCKRMRKKNIYRTTMPNTGPTKSVTIRKFDKGAFGIASLQKTQL